MVIQYRETGLNSLNISVVGYINNFTFTYAFDETINSTWPDGTPPDGTPIQIIDYRLALYVVIVNSVLTGIEGISIFVCLMFNVILRNKKVVRLTSPTLNYIMLIGVVMMAISGIPMQFSNFIIQLINCTLINRVVPVIGYDICFGITLVKTWRIYRIFKGDVVNSSVKDWKLIMIVLVIALVDIIFTLPLSLGAIITNDASLVKDGNKLPTRNDQNVLEEYYLISCNLSAFSVLHIAFSSIIKLVLHIVGLVLAFLTRKVEVSVVNDFKSTSILIYCSTVLILIIAIITPFTLDNENIVTLSWGITVFLMVMMFLGLTFIPKMIAVYKDPKGEMVYKNQFSGTAGPNTGGQLTNISIVNPPTANNDK
jgi:gamma-aminobutyric acid type B receptor